ncbi:innexin inx2-like isoform X2 [Hydractinia symbiolongicarpus]|uniref:innexin inx2-like isoform X2 n=1 Tax=Hydractinia symbiolongicarpus TaxID=13093 RepID=UPI00254E21DD|nr:innexin inx2-like isoform X2 [Hydractinia symbiolongicarpus]
MIVRSLKDVISIKIKARHDSFCDQFSRLFMTKMLLIASVIMGFDYFSDKVSCIVPRASSLSKDFIHSACWISGLFIYAEMKDRLEDSGYYGIPHKIKHDGLRDGHLCETKDLNKVHSTCIRMGRIYYLQYQWMPFYIGALAVLYYFPYIIFRLVNADLVSLKGALKSTSDADGIVKNYFNYKINPLSQLRKRVWLNILVKMIYVAVNLFAFYFTDYLLLGNYVGYGKSYLDWTKLDTTEAHISARERVDPKPGNKLLPSMGLCDIHEATADVSSSTENINKFICEISPNILYQYVLIILWFLFVLSISMSILGLVSNIAEQVYRLGSATSKKTIYRYITLRETEYLTFIRKKNMVLYGDVLRKLKQQRADLQGKFMEGFETSNGFV